VDGFLVAMANGIGLGGGVQQILVAADGLCLREREAGGLLRGVAERA